MVPKVNVKRKCASFASLGSILWSTYVHVIGC